MAAKVLATAWKTAWRKIDRIARKNRNHDLKKNYASNGLELDEKDREHMANALTLVAHCLTHAPNNHVTVTYEHDRNTAKVIAARVSVPGVGVVGLGRWNGEK